MKESLKEKALRLQRPVNRLVEHTDLIDKAGPRKHLLYYMRKETRIALKRAWAFFLAALFTKAMKEPKHVRTHQGPG